MSNLIPKNFIQDVLSRTDVVSIIQSRIELKKRGNTHVACCPFHSEKTPSFTVSHAKQFYYCFGCGAHGDAIRFLMEYDHLTFIDAITDLASQLGLTVPLEKNDDQTAEFNALYDALQQSQKCFEEQLKKSENAITYLKNRGLTGKIAKAFAVGYAPNAWEFLSHSLSFAKKSLATAGMLIEKTPGHYYDRFRDRIMFPIRDQRGRTVGFGGRTLTNEIPKYLNSPETPVFHKNQTLYGLYEMCQHTRKIKRALVVEGYLDVISLAQHGISNAVATLGTALNIKHIQILLRYTNHIIFCFDGDNAGQKAAWKALTISLPLLRDGLDFQFLFLPQTEDPDSLIRKIGAEQFEKLMDRATPLSTVFFEQLAKEFPMDTVAGKAAFGKQAKEYLDTMPEGIYKNLLMDQLALQLHIERNQIAPLKTPEKPALKKPRFVQTRFTPTECAIQLLIHHPEFAQKTELPAMDFSEKTLGKSLLLHLMAQYKENPTLSTTDLFATLPEEFKTTFATILTKAPTIPESGRLTEFTGALQRMAEQEQAYHLSSLIERAKTVHLSDEEKQQLQLLLSKKNTALISQE